MYFENGHLVVEGARLAVLAHFGPVSIRWYALSYIVGIVAGWRLFAHMLKRPCPPMPLGKVGDLVAWLVVGIILGGRIGYILFYCISDFRRDPISIFEIWHGGMSFHGGAAGAVLACLVFGWANKLNGLRLVDYLVVVQPIGQGLGRLANFINGELWGAPTNAPWGVIFRGADPHGIPRQPSQLYEAFLEGAVLLALMTWLFWRTGAARKPGLLVGIYMLVMAIFRIVVEFVREPDAQLVGKTGLLHMGQWLSLPMVAIGAAFVLWSYRRPPLDLPADSALAAQQVA